MLTVLVCGGRYFSDAQHLCRALNTLHAERQIVKIINGGSTPADNIAVRWALKYGVEFHTFPTEWTKHGSKATLMCAIRMLAEAKPDILMVVPGAGTEAIVLQAERAGVEIIEVPHCQHQFCLAF
jgi:hypothetical protein